MLIEINNENDVNKFYKQIKHLKNSKENIKVNINNKSDSQKVEIINTVNSLNI